MAIQRDDVTASLVWGRVCPGDVDADSVSPLPDVPDRKWRHLNRQDLERTFATPACGPLPSSAELAGELKGPLRACHGDLRSAIVEETGFSLPDADDCVRACFSVLDAFCAGRPHAYSAHFDIGKAGAGRRLSLMGSSFGTVAVLLPRNAFPYLALLTALSAVCAGNRVILKSPSHCAASHGLLVDALASLKGLGDSVCLVAASGREFSEACLASGQSGLLHFMGGSASGAQLLRDAFEAGVHFLLDGDGNTLVYVDEGTGVDTAVAHLTTGVLRFNGQTCTSVNGIVAHPTIAQQLGRALAEAMSAATTGDPREPGTVVGPLFSEAQAQAVWEAASGSGGRVVVGDPPVGNVASPLLVKAPDPRSGWVRKGAFGPAAWLAEGTFDDFEGAWARNEFPLCAGVLTPDPEVQRKSAQLPRLARLTLNGDPSAEDPLEPWGGYPSSSNSPVTDWVDRYTRWVQVDRPVEP